MLSLIKYANNKLNSADKGKSVGYTADEDEFYKNNGRQKTYLDDFVADCLKDSQRRFDTAYDTYTQNQADKMISRTPLAFAGGGILGGVGGGFLGAYIAKKLSSDNGLAKLGIKLGGSLGGLLGGTTAAALTANHYANKMDNIDEQELRDIYDKTL